MTSELHSAVVQWFKLFPEFRSNPLHIFGESYGAKYAIQLAMKIHETNDFLDQALKVGGFKGRKDNVGWLILSQLKERSFR